MSAIGSSITWAQRAAGATTDSIAIQLWTEGWDSFQTRYFNKETTIQQIADNFVKPNRNLTNITSYGIAHPPSTKAIDILKRDPTTILFVNHSTPTGIEPRTYALAAIHNAYIRSINEILKMVWETYSHSTCGVVAYVAEKLQETKLKGEFVTLMDAEHFVRGIQNGVRQIDSRGSVFDWDSSSGDCSSVHYFLARKLGERNDLKSVRWHYYEGGTHALLFGTSPDGAGFLIDLGGVREVMFTGGVGVFQGVPKLGKANNATENRLTFRVSKIDGGSVKIEMKKRVKEGEETSFIVMEHLSTAEQLFDRVLLPIAVKKEYILYIRSVWPLYHVKIILDPLRKTLTVHRYNTHSNNAVFGGNNVKEDGSWILKHGSLRWPARVKEMYELLEQSENWRRGRTGGIVLDTNVFRSWRVLCGVVFRDLDRGVYQ